MFLGGQMELTFHVVFADADVNKEKVRKAGSNKTINTFFIRPLILQIRYEKYLLNKVGWLFSPRYFRMGTR